MKKRTKRTIILGAALCLMIWGGYTQNPAKAGYTGVADNHYDYTIDGNNGGTRMMTGSQNIDSYHFLNLGQNQENYDDGGALSFAANSSYNRIDNSLFQNNHGMRGGAVFDWGSSTTIFTNVKFISNTAESGGGAVYATGPSVQFNDSWFENNHSALRGGALYFNPDSASIMSTMTIRNTDFINNTAEQDGGAIYIHSSKNTIMEPSIVVNDGQTHKMSGNMHNTNRGNDYYKPESNAIYINQGSLKLRTLSNADSRLVIDDGIQGSSIENAALNIEADTGNITLNGTVKDLTLTHKSGILLLNHGDKLENGKPILDNVDLIIDPKSSLRFDLANGKLDILNIKDLTVKEATGDNKAIIAFDVDLNQGKSDFFNVEGTITGNLLFDTDHFELNIIEDGNADKFQILNSGYAGMLVGENVQFNDISKYVFSVGEDGYINVIKTDTSGLPDAVIAEGIREYTPSTLDGTVVGKDLGAMAGESLKINMQGSDLDGNSKEGITVGENQKLEFKNGGNTGGAAIHNFKTAANGALANNIGGEVVVTDSTIENNTAEGLGGAIYSEGGKVTLNANERDVIFRYNTAKGLAPETPALPETPDTANDTPDSEKPVISNNNDIYLKDAQMTVNGSKNTIIESGIAGTGEIQKNDTGILKLAGDNSLYTGALSLNGGEIQLLDGAKFFNPSNTNVLSTTNVNLINNNPTDRVNFGDLNLSTNATLGIDADLGNGASDKIGATSVTGDGKIIIDNINLSSLGATSTGGEFSVITLDEAGDSPLLGYVEMAGGNNQESMGPIYKYASSFDPNTGMMKISSLGGGNSSGYNPAVLAGPVATLIGGYLTQLNTYDMAFNNMDLYMLMTKEERMALKYANRYAAASLGGVYSPLMMPNGANGGSFTTTPYDDGSTWFKPYSMFEDVKLKHGPKVSNIAYGSFFGYDSKLKELGHGWDGMWSVYGGYNGSHQTYQGNGIYQNGGTLGATGMLYKGNFYTGITANAGANAANANTMYDDEDFAMFMAGVAWKLGYNSEFFNSKLIIQPNYMMSYSFVDTFDYTNGAGLDIDSKPLNALQFMPGLRIIGNLPGGWKPYLAASMVWTALDDADFTANDVSLPELSIKPYFNYGVGLQKSGERFGGFFQTMMRAGGREGVFLQAGFNFAI